MNKPLILSGFLQAEAATVEEAVGKSNFRIVTRYEMDEWGAFLCEPAV